MRPLVNILAVLLVVIGVVAVVYITMNNTNDLAPVDEVGVPTIEEPGIGTEEDFGAEPDLGAPLEGEGMGTEETGAGQ